MKEDQEGVRTLTNLLAQCLDIFPLYGREPEAASNLRKAFRLALADYPIDKIVAAFSYHLKQSRDFPLPADIAVIIERGNKPPFDKSVYVSIQKKHGEDRSADEWQYLRDYERLIISGRF